MQKIIGIYVIINLKNNKRYIGSSFNISKRLYEHKRLLRKGEHGNTHLQNAWNKYGEDGFSFDVLETISLDKSITNRELRDLETFYIEQFKTYIPEFGYNIIPGGIGTINYTISQETKDKISKSNKGKIPPNKGVPMSDEQKLLLREIKTQKYGKSVDVYDKYGNFIETVPSIREVSRKYEISRSAIVNNCNGHGGVLDYIFQYHDNHIDSIEYTKNKTCGFNMFVIENIDSGEITYVKYKKGVVKFLTGRDTRNGSLERKLNTCINGDSLHYKNYIISFINALHRSDSMNVQGQLNNYIEGTNNLSANGET